MSNPRDYDVEIRDAGMEYFNEGHRFYANVSSTDAVGEDGAVKLRIGRSGQQITLTTSEAKEIGVALMNAAHGATPPRDRVVGHVIDDAGRDLKVTQSILENGGDRINFGLALQGNAEMKKLQSVLLKAYPVDAG